MGYYAADKNGYLEDVASIGGMRDLRQWGRTQAPVIRQLLANGVSDSPKDLAAALRSASSEGAVKSTVLHLADVADRAEELLILSDGNNERGGSVR